MSIRLRNSWKLAGDDPRWDWTAFLDDGGSGELSNVKYVEYVLHPTFPQPLRKVSDPEGGFVLKENGWGSFILKAFVHMKDGKKIKLSWDIVLLLDPPEGTTA